jgi:hypothetical protein
MGSQERGDYQENGREREVTAKKKGGGCEAGNMR